jgi:hypothetical protein
MKNEEPVTVDLVYKALREILHTIEGTSELLRQDAEDYRRRRDAEIAREEAALREKESEQAYLDHMQELSEQNLYQKKEGGADE